MGSAPIKGGIKMTAASSQHSIAGIGERRIENLENLASGWGKHHVRQRRAMWGNYALSLGENGGSLDHAQASAVERRKTQLGQG